jgi:hypothetical protein
MIATAIPFEVGALYSRQDDIHAKFEGQERGGIVTPALAPYVFIFTGEAGVTHGYNDEWEKDDIFHYYGEGQIGDMTYTRGNKAVRDHAKNGKKLLLFQMMGKSQPVRYLGEFEAVDTYQKDGVLDTAGNKRKAIIFKLRPAEMAFQALQGSISMVLDSEGEIDLDRTVAKQTLEVRRKQYLFRRRLIGVEKQCRLTGIRDLRFLRASHIKPWSKCSTGNERIDGNNGLLLCPQADLLFDQGWITFRDQGALVRSPLLPIEVVNRLGIDLTNQRLCGAFNEKQTEYLEFHRNSIFERRFRDLQSPLDSIISHVTANY